VSDAQCIVCSAYAILRKPRHKTPMVIRDPIVPLLSRHSQALVIAIAHGRYATNTSPRATKYGEPLIALCVENADKASYFRPCRDCSMIDSDL